MSHLLAQVQDLIQSPIGILYAMNVALTTAVVSLYRDCKKDRAKIWRAIRNQPDLIDEDEKMTE